MNSNPFRLPADYPPPRQILREHFPNTANELLIKGGWGYEIEDATVVLEFDPEINPDHRFSGVSIENVFIQKRIWEELTGNAIAESGMERSGSLLKWVVRDIMTVFLLM